MAPRPNYQLYMFRTITLYLQPFYP